MDPARRTALPRRHTLIKCPLRALLLFRKQLSSTVPMHASVRSHGHRPCPANRLRPNHKLFCFFAGGFVCPCKRITPPPLLAVGRSPQPVAQAASSSRRAPCYTKWQCIFASVRQSHVLLHDPAACPVHNLLPRLLPLLPSPFSSELCCSSANSSSLSLRGPGTSLFIVPAISTVSPPHLHPQARIQLALPTFELDRGRVAQAGMLVGGGMGEQLQPDGEVKNPGKLSPVCFSQSSSREL